MPDRSLQRAGALPKTRKLKAGLMVALLALLPACATTQAPHDSPLTGHWQLERNSGDDVRAMVTQAVDRAQANLRRRYHLGSGPRATPAGAGPGDAGSGGAAAGAGDQTFESAGDLLGNGLVIGPDFRQLRTRLLDTLQTPGTLTLQVHSDTVNIQRDTLPPTDYQPGETITRFDEYGAARLVSRWSGPAFEIQERYTSGARLTERFEVGAGGALTYTRLLLDPTVGKLSVRSVYRRG
jgi:hypothetical protein